MYEEQSQARVQRSDISRAESKVTLVLQPIINDPVLQNPQKKPQEKEVT